MSKWDDLGKLVHSVFRCERTECDISDELQFHLELLIKHYIAEGLTPEEARSAARRRFGNLRQFNDQCQKIYTNRRGRLMRGLGQNIIYGFRLLMKHRGFTIIAVLSFPLGIGVNATMSSLVDM